jgi:hypothetical protein
MTSRDLIQQRTTLPNGDTTWQNSPLVTAALEGKLAVLDGVHRIHPSTLAVIHRYMLFNFIFHRKTDVLTVLNLKCEISGSHSC